MHPNIRKHLHEYIWGNSHLSINQTKSAKQMIYFSYRQVLKTNYNNLNQKINESHSSIKSDFNCSKNQIHFLNIRKAKRSSGKLLTGNLIFIENQSTLKLLNETSPICKQWDWKQYVPQREISHSNLQRSESG